jgi:hypothetical protein
MDDLERDLRAAMHAAAEPPPAGLLAAVRRRHRRHRRRVGAGCVLAVAALALAAPPVTHALRGAAPGRPPVAPAIAAPTPTAAPGTVLSGCGSAIIGQLGSHWRTGGREAGPLWFLSGGHSRGRLQVYVLITVITGVRPGAAVVVRVAPEGRPYLRFLFGPQDSLQAGTPYTMGSGEAGVTFTACAAGSGLYTDYYGGMLVAGQRCVPVDVWPPGTARPITVRLGACAGWGPYSPQG